MNKRILLIEDEGDIRDLYATLLQNKGYIVDCANDGQQGFRLATTGEYFIVISDLKMPNWDGIDSIDSILLVKPDTKFIVVTGYADSDKANQLKDNYAILRIFSKPVDLNDLIDAVESI